MKISGTSTDRIGTAGRLDWSQIDCVYEGEGVLFKSINLNIEYGCVVSLDVERYVALVGGDTVKERYLVKSLSIEAGNEMGTRQKIKRKLEFID